MDNERWDVSERDGRGQETDRRAEGEGGTAEAPEEARETADSFDRLIADMRHDEPDVVPESRDNVCALLNTLADRLEALVRDRALPPHGEGVPWDDALETTPIYRDVLRQVTGDV